MSKNETKQWLNLLMLTFGLVIIVMSVFEFLLYVRTSIWKYVVLFEFGFISLVLPICLVHIHLYFKKKSELKGHRLIHLFFILTCIVFASIIDYYGGQYSGQYVDSETRDVSVLGILFQSAIAFLIGCVSFYGNFSNSDTESNTDESVIA